MSVKNVEEMWEDYKKINFGKNIDKIHPIQLIESEKVFYAAMGRLLVELRDHVSLLPEEHAVVVLQKMFLEVNLFFDKAVEEYKRIKS